MSWNVTLFPFTSSPNPPTSTSARLENVFQPKSGSILQFWEINANEQKTILNYHPEICTFLAVPRQLNRWPCHWVIELLLIVKHVLPGSIPGRLWPLRHLIRMMWGLELSNKKTVMNTITKTNIVTKVHWRKHSKKSVPRDLWLLRHLIRVMRGLSNKKTMTKPKTFRLI